MMGEDWLQLFAQDAPEGSAEAGAAEGAEQQLLALGVPEEKLRGRGAHRRSGDRPDGVARTEGAGAAAEGAEDKEGSSPSVMPYGMTAPLDAGGELDAEPEGALQEEAFWRHISALEQQARELQREFPGFDLRRELRNPVFARLTAPGSGIGVADAYHAVHRRELRAAEAQAAAQATARMISNAIRAGAHRPVENGGSHRPSPVGTFDYRKASPDQRQALRAFIRSEAAQGRKVYPGSYPL